jgi:hypothetical protein
VPYFITDESADCSGWAVVKEDGEVIGCHTTKAAAIDQMVAVSLAEGIEPGGERAVRAVSVPDYIASAAQRGLDLRREGYGGDGLADSTIREARQMAAGEITDGKVIRAAAWAARHAVDLEAPQNRNPDHPDWPGAGAVAHYLWGINPTNPGPARRFFEREAAQIQGRATVSSIEIRSMETEELEFRAADPDKGSVGTFSGYAARYNSPSLPLPFTERIAPGAFARTLKSRNDVRMYVNHDDRMVLASTRAKTLRLEDRADGLFVEADLPDVSYANDLRALIERGDVRTMSFGFSTVKDSWSVDGNERTLNEVRLHEVSVVTGVAAYPATSATVRNLRSLAFRTDTDAEALADAIGALESGAELTDEQAEVLKMVVDRSRPATIADPSPSIPLSILQKQIDLLAKNL